jgi:hypothetical protein
MTGGGPAAGGGRHGAVHRALPQRGHGRPRRGVIRAIEERGPYLVELDERRKAVLGRDREQGKLTPDLEARIRAVHHQGRRSKTSTCPTRRSVRRAPASPASAASSRLAARIMAQPLDGEPADEARPSAPRRRCPTSMQRSRAPATSCAEAWPSTPTCALVRDAFAQRGRDHRVVKKTTEQGHQVRGYYATFEEPVAQHPLAPLPGHPPRRRRRACCVKLELDARAADAAACARRMNLNPARRGRASCEAPSTTLQAPLEAQRRDRRARRPQSCAPTREAVEVFAKNLASCCWRPRSGSDRARHRPGPAHRLQVRRRRRHGAARPRHHLLVQGGEAWSAKPRPTSFALLP